MKLCKKLLLTVGREYGSGGHLICEALAKALDIPVYDRNLIGEIAEKHDLDERGLRAGDEKLANPFFESYYSIGTETSSSSMKLFALQSAVIREKADEGSAIFVGRCADDVLKDYDGVVNIFIFAPYEDRIARLMEMSQIDRREAEKKERRVEKSRRTFYQFYTDQRWGGSEGKDLLINSSALGIDGTVQFILGFLHMLGYVED